MSEFRLNGHPVAGKAVLETVDFSRKRIWAAITVPSGSPAHQAAREAVLANDLEVTLDGEAHEPVQDAFFDFKAKGQLVNGRVGSDIKADFVSTKVVELHKQERRVNRPSSLLSFCPVGSTGQRR